MPLTWKHNVIVRKAADKTYVAKGVCVCVCVMHIQVVHVFMLTRHVCVARVCFHHGDRRRCLRR